MKILNVNHSIDCITGGGTAERSYQISRFLQKKGFECQILTLDPLPSTEKIDALSGVKIISLPCWNRRFYVPKPALLKIRSAVKNADIVCLNGHWTLLNLLVYFFIRQCQKPYIVTPAGALPIFGRSRILKKMYNFLGGSQLIKKAHGFVAIASNEVEHFTDYGIPKQDIIFIPNGVDPTLFSDLNNTFIPPTKNPYILFVGRLSLIKGPDLLIEAFSKLPQRFDSYHLILAGPDEGLLAPLKKMIEKFKLADRIHFTGPVSGIQKTMLYQNSEFLVIPSRSEAMSMVVLEAGCLGKPALITNQCGFDEIEKIRGGFVVEANADGLQKGLNKMLENSSTLAMLGDNLKNHILTKYSWDLIIETLINLLEKIIPISRGASK